MRRLIAATLLLVLTGVLSSCGTKDLNPVEQASVFAENMFTTYTAIHETYQNLEMSLKGDDLKKLHKAAPSMNKAKKYIIEYTDLVIKWREEGGEEPMDLITNRTLLNALLADVSMIIIDFY